MPARADIQPGQLSSILPLIVLVDVEQDPRRYRIRLMGSESVKVIGEDMTGQYIDVYQNHETIAENMSWLVENRAPYLACDKLDRKTRNYLNYYALGLPLSENDRDVNMILFGFKYFFNTVSGGNSPISMV